MSFESTSPFKIPIRNLKVMGMWPNKESSRKYRMYSVVSHLIFMDIILALEITALCTYETFDDVLNTLCTLPAFIGANVRTLNFLVNFREVEEVMKMSKELYEICPDTTKVKQRLDNATRIFKIFMFGAVACGVAACLSTLYELPYRIWFPYDTDENLWAYVIVAAYVSLEILAYGHVIVTLDLFPVFFFSYAIGFMEALCDSLRSFRKQYLEHSSRQDFNNNQKELKKLIDFQIKVDEYLKKILKPFSFVFILQGLISVIALCTIIFLLINVRKSLQHFEMFMHYLYSQEVSLKDDPMRVCFYFFYMFTVIIQTLIPCYYGSEIMAVSDKLSASLFHSEWMYENKNFKTSMMVFLEKVKKPIKTTIFGFYDVNLSTFTAICHTTFSLYAVLRSLK